MVGRWNSWIPENDHNGTVMLIHVSSLIQRSGVNLGNRFSFQSQHFLHLAYPRSRRPSGPARFESDLDSCFLAFAILASTSASRSNCLTSRLAAPTALCASACARCASSSARSALRTWCRAVSTDGSTCLLRPKRPPPVRWPVGEVPGLWY
jgi:hypothetical protein